MHRTGTTSGTAQFSFSNTGSLVYIPGPVSAAVNGDGLALFDRKGNAESLKLPSAVYSNPRVSPDGKWIAYGTDDGKEAIVWVYDLSGAASPHRLTFGGNNRYPIWSADGRRIAFQSDREGDLGIFWQIADGSGTAERLTKAEAGTSHIPQSWFPKEEKFSFEVTKESRHSLWIFSIRDRSAAPVAGIQSGNYLNSVLSPDGRWLAYSSNETGSPAIYVQPFPPTGAKHQVSNAGGLNNSPVWSPDGKELLYVPSAGQFAALSISTQPSFTFGSPVLLTRGFEGSVISVRNFDITPDGSFIGTPTGGLAADSGGSGSPLIQIVLNWFEELKQRVPVK